MLASTAFSNAFANKMAISYMKSLKLGIVGCGGIANGKHLPAIKKEGRAQVVAFCDIIEERANKAAKKYGTKDSKVFTDYRELIKLDLDAVYVCTPNRSHCEITVAALNAGKHVMCEIRRLTPDLAEDYIHFFDITPHDDNVGDNKCYCACWRNDEYAGKDFSIAENRRKYAYQYVKGNNIQRYLAYSDDKIVGWCNANTKSDCLKCASWQRFMSYVPLEESNSGIKIKSIFCFVIAPDMKR